MTHSSRIVVHSIADEEVKAMEDQYAWVRNPRVIVPIILLVLSPAIAKIILSIIGIF